MIAVGVIEIASRINVSICAATVCALARITPQIKREMRRRAAVEPVIGHPKNEHRMDRNYLHHRSGDASNAILAAIGYNFSLLLRWLRLLLRLILAALPAPAAAGFRVLHGRLQKAIHRAAVLSDRHIGGDVSTGNLICSHVDRGHLVRCGTIQH
jgi:hypothetical protein